MKKIIAVVLSSLIVLSGCGQASIEGEYKALEGKVGIFQMNAMTVQKDAGGDKYRINFIGDKKTLTYENVEFKDGELKIRDKGFDFPVKIDGNKATVVVGGAKFEKISK
jgi:hypothetical protein